MYRLKQIIDNVGEDRQITPELKVEDDILEKETDYAIEEIGK